MIFLCRYYYSHWRIQIIYYPIFRKRKNSSLHLNTLTLTVEMLVTSRSRGTPTIKQRLQSLVQFSPCVRSIDLFDGLNASLCLHRHCQDDFCLGTTKASLVYTIILRLISDTIIVQKMDSSFFEMGLSLDGFLLGVEGAPDFVCCFLFSVFQLYNLNLAAQPFSVSPLYSRYRSLQQPAISNVKHMQKLSPRISQYTPESPDQEDQLAILFNCEDAQRKHITKYIQLHKSITTRASILLIQTSAATLFQPYTWQRAALKPAAQYIVENALTNDRQQTSSPEKGRGQTQQEQGRTKTKILFHLCSNGGSLTATQLLILLRRMTHAPLPLIGIVMDSAPDSGGYNHTHNAVVQSQPSRP